MTESRMRLLTEFKDQEARRDYADSFLSASIALQIKVLRQQRGWSQKKLAERAGMKQSRISALEDVDYSSWSVTTLRRLAEAFDLALRVEFNSFGELLDEVDNLSRKALERPSFDEDDAFLDANSAVSEPREIVAGTGSYSGAGESEESPGARERR